MHTTHGKFGTTWRSNCVSDNKPARNHVHPVFGCRKTLLIYLACSQKCHAHRLLHYIDVIMTTMTSQITSLTVVYSIVCSGADQRKHQSSASLAFVRGIHRNSPHKGPVTQKIFPFDDVIMCKLRLFLCLVIRGVLAFACHLKLMYQIYICSLRWYPFPLLGLVVHTLSHYLTAENVWVRAQHCSYWCPGAKAPGH